MIRLSFYRGLLAAAITAATASAVFTNEIDDDQILLPQTDSESSTNMNDLISAISNLAQENAKTASK